jgi:septal ring factor EnvC (AmiA/AmiB activator)
LLVNGSLTIDMRNSAPMGMRSKSFLRIVGRAGIVLFAVGGPMMALTRVRAEQPPPGPVPIQSGQGSIASRNPSKAQHEQELEAIHAEQKKAAVTEALLKAAIRAIGENRRALNQDLIETASRLRGVEERIARTEARLAELEANERAARKSLQDRNAIIIEVLAALQRLGRRPPPAILVAPEDALASVRTAILLGAILPEMRREAEALAAALAELVRVRRDISVEREDLSRDLASLSEDRRRMTLLVEERQKKQAEAEKALEAERERASALARQAESLQELIARMEQEIVASARAAKAAAHAGRDGKAPGDGRASLAALKDPGRLAPAIAFGAAKGALPLPVSGVKIRDFGASDRLGGTEKGLWIASRSGAQVTAPCDGWVVYAGQFRSYGQLLILNAGGGYHVLLAGMERISVDLGQFVLIGEPVAAMGDGPQSTAAIAIGSSQPVLYVEFRKDGTPVDPSPWWAISDSEKVRG